MRISPSINVNKIPHHLYIQALNTKSMSAEHIDKKTTRLQGVKRTSTQPVMSHFASPSGEKKLILLLSALLCKSANSKSVAATHL